MHSLKRLPGLKGLFIHSHHHCYCYWSAFREINAVAQHLNIYRCHWPQGLRSYFVPTEWATVKQWDLIVAVTVMKTLFGRLYCSSTGQASMWSDDRLSNHVFLAYSFQKHSSGSISHPISQWFSIWAVYWCYWGKFWRVLMPRPIDNQLNPNPSGWGGVYCATPELDDDWLS